MGRSDAHDLRRSADRIAQKADGAAPAAERRRMASEVAALHLQAARAEGSLAPEPEIMDDVVFLAEDDIVFLPRDEAS